jgi:hypothetical protein
MYPYGKTILILVREYHGEEGGDGERVQEGEHGANTVYTCMQMEKCYLLKLFQEWGRGGKRRIVEE